MASENISYNITSKQSAQRDSSAVLQEINVRRLHDRLWHFFTDLSRAERGSSAQVFQTSIFSAISIASSISMPR